MRPFAQRRVRVNDRAFAEQIVEHRHGDRLAQHLLEHRVVQDQIVVVAEDLVLVRRARLEVGRAPVLLLDETQRRFLEALGEAGRRRLLRRNDGQAQRLQLGHIVLELVLFDGGPHAPHRLVAA